MPPFVDSVNELPPTWSVSKELIRPVVRKERSQHGRHRTNIWEDITVISLSYRHHGIMCTYPPAVCPEPLGVGRRADAFASAAG